MTQRTNKKRKNDSRAMETKNYRSGVIPIARFLLEILSINETFFYFPQYRRHIDRGIGESNRTSINDGSGSLRVSLCNFVAEIKKIKEREKMSGETIDTIAKEINRQCRDLKEKIIIKAIDENKKLNNIYHCYKEAVFPLESKMEFASIYSQTAVFVLLSAALFDSRQEQDQDLNKKLIDIIHRLRCSNTVFLGILKSIFNIGIPGRLSSFINNIKEKITGCQTGDLKEDDILALVYQRFLKRYEPGIHKKIKYYITPRPVVSFMVYTIHRLLKEKLNIEDGLANLDIKIMDPAFGNGNFLCEALRLALEERAKKYGAGILIDFIDCYLSRNIHGSEIMLPLYVMGFINLHKIIKNFCADLQDFQLEKYLYETWQKEEAVHGLKYEKNISGEPGFNLFRYPSVPFVQLYLEDTLENSDIGNLSFEKKSTCVIFCNPPYSRHSLNKGERICGLVSDYYRLNDYRIEEKNFKGLQDDYVKFLRFAQWKIDQNGAGVMGFITNNSYLENPTFRGMRYSLLKSFDEIYILDLHGTARHRGKKPGDENDENIFGVGQGIAIGFFIKRKRPGQVRENIESLDCKVYYASMKGSKAFKLKNLENLKERDFKAIQWERVIPVEKFYLFTPGKPVDQYGKFVSVSDIFPLHGVGIVTARDSLTIKDTESKVNEVVWHLYHTEEKYLSELYKSVKDTRDWQIKAARKDLIDSHLNNKMIVPILYRPFDIRYTYYTGRSRGFLCMPRPGVMRQMLQENLGLVTVRQVPGGFFNHCFVADTIIDSRVTTSQKGIAYIFPLYKYVFPGEQENKRFFKYNDVFPVIENLPRGLNIDPVVYDRLKEIFGRDKLPSERQIFYYIYAILNCRIYRERYRDHLKIDFPRVPFNVKPGLFMRLSGLGEDLVDIHLMKSPDLNLTFSKFEVIGDNLVKDLLFKSSTGTGRDGRVYIDDTQYFSNITKEIWEFEICGYQVLWKWLKDRKNRVLSTGEILHYIKICRAVQLTIEKYKQIDRLYSELEKDL